MLLARGASLHAADSVGYTALMHACADGHCEAAQELLEQGASTEARSVDGWLPLMLACSYGHDDVARVMLEHGANVNATRTGTLMTTLMAACNSLFLRSGHSAPQSTAQPGRSQGSSATGSAAAEARAGSCSRKRASLWEIKGAQKQGLRGCGGKGGRVKKMKMFPTF